MNDSRTCPRCQSTLPAESAGELCPKCLIAQALAEESEPAAKRPSADRTTTPPGSHAFEPPKPEEIAGSFPELEILELIGRGGMGAVYKARQGKLDRIVALKVLPREIGTDSSFSERFTREARALARLSHANIVALYDFGEVDGLCYFLMEYIDGANLRQVLAQQKMTPEEALKIVPQLCDALQYAHEQGVVHRDIKPENILLDRRGRVKIADFGLSKLIHLEGVDHSLTATHQVMGTLRYMAPEQMLGSKKVDHRADIYSLGIVFYELLTGQVPMGRFDPPSRKVQIDIRLDEVVLRTLEQEPDRRYQHASDVKQAVESVTSSPAIAGEPFDSATQWSSLSAPELQSHCEQIARDLRAPAVGLFLAGLAMVLTAALLIAWSGITIARIESAPAAAPQTTSQTEGGASMEQSVTVTQDPHPWSKQRGLIWALLWSQILSLAVGGLLMAAATQLSQLEFRSLAVGGCVLAMLPLSLVWPLTLPLGGWLLLRLSRPKVRRAFAAVASERAEMPANVSLFDRWSIASTLGAVIGTCLLVAPWLPWVGMNFFGTQFTLLGIDGGHGRWALGIALVAVWASVAIDLARQSPRWRGAIMLLAALGIGGAVGHQAYAILQPEEVTMSNSQGDESLMGLAEIFADQLRDNVSAELLLGVYVAAAVALFGLIYGLVELVRPRAVSEDRSPAARLRGPAIGLIASGVLGLALDMILISLMSSSMTRPEAPWLVALAVLFVILFRLPMIAGAIGMLSIFNRRLAFAASVIALLPLNIVVLLSLPMGIWGLVVLSRPDVRAAFEQTNAQRRDASPESKSGESELVASDAAGP